MGYLDPLGYSTLNPKLFRVLGSGFCKRVESRACCWTMQLGYMFLEAFLRVGSGLRLGTLGLRQVSTLPLCRLGVEGCGRLLHLHTKVIYGFGTC